MFFHCQRCVCVCVCVCTAFLISFLDSNRGTGVVLCLRFFAFSSGIYIPNVQSPCSTNTGLVRWAHYFAHGTRLGLSGSTTSFVGAAFFSGPRSICCPPACCNMQTNASNMVFSRTRSLVESVSSSSLHFSSLSS